MRMDILNRLKALLPDEVVYHDINHTLNVEKAAMRFARLEGLDDESIQLLRTAVLYHDSGFIIDYQHNESHGIAMAEKALPKFGYSVEHIERVRSIIASTASNQKPTTLLEQIMCDADHDYLGRADYFIVAKKLRIELENYGHVMSEIEWVEFQLNYLEKVHRFYTETAQNIRLQAKKARIEELKQQLNKLKKEQ
jgi:predicted metal-dependent HD superfamily phosphohydrolase